MKVVNIFGSPGAGKSTARAGLFYKMKMSGSSVEEVTEYAKDVVWEERYNVFQDQLYLLAKQNRKLLRLREKVEYVLTDSPIILNAVYLEQCKHLNKFSNTLSSLILEVFNEYDNINIFLNRKHKYEEIGRYQSELESDEISKNIKQLLYDNNIQFLEIDSNHLDIDKLYELILSHK